jgi:hypothetical protein
VLGQWANDVTPEARRLHQLAARATRRMRLQTALQCLGAAVAAAFIAPHGWGMVGRLAAGLAAGALAWFAWRRVRRAPSITAHDYARHLDALQPELEDSTELLLRAPTATPHLRELQRTRVAGVFARIDDAGQLERTLPPMALGRIAGAWAVAFGVVLVALLLARGADVRTDPATADERRPRIERATVRLQPPDYLRLPASTTQRLDIETFEGTRVEWTLQLESHARAVALLFHDGNRLELDADGRGRWRSRPWPARSSVYRVLVDDGDIPDGIFRIDARADQAPRLSVVEPASSLRVLAPGAAPDVRLRLVFDAHDDYGIVDAVARVTLARGSGEQVRFREQAVPLTFITDDNGRRIHADHEFDLLALGMEPGDELYLFAQAIDNRAGEPNVGSSGTYIVRWPGEDDIEAQPVATMAVSVLPEFFRSQRQIIIDTERLRDERRQLDEAQFAQRAQTLAADQKLLRLRYGQYLGEEDDSGIGPATIASMARAADDEDDHLDAEQHTDDDHEGHAPGADDDVRSGDAQAAIELYGHFHDREEQSTLFDPQTTSLLKSALAQMWQAELQLRLGRPRPALGFEYAALDLIKQVQQSSRVYLRRTGFRPTPIDEGRRLSGELDDIVTRQVRGDSDTAGDRARMRALLTVLTGEPDARRSVATRLAALEPVIAEHAAIDAQWLATLGAVQRLMRDGQCEDCRVDLVAALWERLDDTVAAPTARSASSHPLAQAYRRQMSSSTNREGTPASSP